MKKSTWIHGLPAGLGAIAVGALLAAAPAAVAQGVNDPSTPANARPSSGMTTPGHASGMTQRSSTSSAQVRQIQQALSQAGHDPGKVDGIWGRKTSEALKDFQQAKGLNATGRPDRQTLAALGVQGTGMSDRSRGGPMAPGRGAEDQAGKGNTATSRSRNNAGGPGGSLDRSQRPAATGRAISPPDDKGNTALPRSRNNAGGPGGSLEEQRRPR